MRFIVIFVISRERPRDVHGEVVLRQYSEHKAEQQEQYKELQVEPMLTSLL